LTPEEVSATMVGCIDNALHFHTDIATIPFRTTLQAIEVAAAADCMIFTDVDSDPIYLIEEVGLGRRKELEAILAKSDVLKVCRLAALRLTGAADLETACRQLHETCGARYVAVTMGREGSLLAGNGTLWHIPVLGPPAVDPTGAGGAYFGGFSYAILHGMQGVDAGLFASACAAVACSHMGGEGIGRLDQIQQMLAAGADQAPVTGDDIPAGT
jgi:sugar/nucleoside kinase (ribokinase family)